MSVSAERRRISSRTSSGREAIGHGGGGVPSIEGGAPWMASVAKEVMSSETLETEFGGPWREWWAGLGTVTAAFEGFELAGFEEREDGGKYLFL